MVRITYYLMNISAMKYVKIAVLTVISMLCFSTIVNSQVKKNAQVNVQISLVKGLNLHTVQGDLNFGEIVQTGVSSNLIKTPGKGLVLEVNGSPGKDVFVNYGNVTLDNENWTKGTGGIKGLMTFSPIIEHTKANNTYSQAIPISSGNAYTLRESSGNGLLYLWIGGEIEVAQFQPSGDYEGQFNVTVAY